MIEGEGFTIDEKKFDYFFGRVISNPYNESRSRSNLEGLNKLGIEENEGGKEKLLQIFNDGLNAPQVEIVYDDAIGAIEISYFYLNGDLNCIPKIVTIVIKIYKD